LKIPINEYPPGAGGGATFGLASGSRTAEPATKFAELP
jgi:hypothetical protein